MPNISDWNELHERVEHCLPHGLDEATWQAVQQHPLPFVADELLWRVEAIALQVSAQGTIFLQPVVRAGRQHEGDCALCAEQPGRGFGQRCTRCVAAICLVLGAPLLLDDEGRIDGGEMDVPNQQDEPGASNLFDL